MTAGVENTLEARAGAFSPKAWTCASATPPHSDRVSSQARFSRLGAERRPLTCRWISAVATGFDLCGMVRRITYFRL